jgi:hypothetical protein
VLVHSLDRRRGPGRLQPVWEMVKVPVLRLR